jgi:hypothetical protein
MRAWTWALLATVGLALMLISYREWVRGDPEAPGALGFLFVGDAEPAKTLDVGTIVSTRLRYLPVDPTVEATLKGVQTAMAGGAWSVEAQVRPKLIELPVDEMGLLVGWLKEGRMPEPGRDELLAGPRVALGDHPEISGRPFQVVGVLRPSVALFSDSYLMPKGESSAAAFPDGDPSVHRVTMVRMSPTEFGERKNLVRAMEAYPAKSFGAIRPSTRLEPEAFSAYLAGQVLFLLGGTGLLIGLYRWLAGRFESGFLGPPLRELAARPRLLWGVHLAYFGLYLMGALVVSRLPILQTVLMAAVGQAFDGGGKNPLAVAGAAYGTGNILYAAVVTFLINFPLGSFAMISLPSMIVPGCGALLAAFRATLWGLLLGPSEAGLAAAMLAHSGTLLLEGGGYILATFFALLVPIYLLGPGHGTAKSAGVDVDRDEFEPLEPPPPAPRDTMFGRLGRAVALNLRAQVLVALVLAVAACYEAVEVILMAGL